MLVCNVINIFIILIRKFLKGFDLILKEIATPKVTVEAIINAQSVTILIKLEAAVLK